MTTEPKQRLRVYVAGPYSADNVMGVLSNIRRGIKWSYKLFQYGFAPFTPWLDYHYVLEDEQDTLTVQDFYEYSLEWLRVSDVMFVQGDWTKSAGTVKEIEEAQKTDIPVFYEGEDGLVELLCYAYKRGYKLTKYGETCKILMTKL